MGYVEGTSGGDESETKENVGCNNEDVTKGADGVMDENGSGSEGGSMSEDEGPRGRTTSRGD